VRLAITQRSAANRVWADLTIEQLQSDTRDRAAYSTCQQFVPLGIIDRDIAGGKNSRFIEQMLKFCRGLRQPACCRQLSVKVFGSAKVERVLQGAHDPTPVQSERIRPGFTAFGQTIWPHNDQVTFVSTIACDRQRHVCYRPDEPHHEQPKVASARSRTPNSKAVGDQHPQGQYLVRQFGLIVTPTGTFAVAIAAEPTSGAFTDGIHQLDLIAGWLALHVDALPAGHCA
jgi:hypothetical protein